VVDVGQARFPVGIKYHESIEMVTIFVSEYYCIVFFVVLHF
jgi:hypothetical protein